MAQQSALINHLGRSLLKLLLVVSFLLILIFTLGFVSAYKNSIQLKTLDIVTFKKSDLLQIISNDNDDSRIALNFSLAEIPTVKQFVIYNKAGMIKHRFRKDNLKTLKPVKLIQGDTLKIDLHYKNATLQGPIQIGARTIGYYQIAYSNTLFKKYLFFFMLVNVLAILAVYFFFSWILSKVSTIYKENIKKISYAIDALNLDDIDNDEQLFDLKDIIVSNRHLIKDLKESRRQLDSSLMVSRTDLQGNFTYVNQKFCDISKFSRAELLEKGHAIVNSGEHASEFWHTFWSTIQSGKKWKGEICNRNKDGDIFWVQATVLPLFDNSGELREYAALNVDITHKKESEKIILHQSKLAMIGEMAAGVGHEINNPLAICVGNIELLEKTLLHKASLDTEVVNRIDKLKIGHQRIRKIVDGLRTYARSDTENFEIFSINLAIQQTIDLIAEVYTDANIQIIQDLPLEDFYILGDIGKFQQVLMNFISNAKDATVDELAREISISLVKGGNNTLQFSVADNGTGIPDQIKGKILNPFFTTKKLGHGTGIGLGIVNQLIKTMQGKLIIDSTVGKGSCFKVILPLANKNELASAKEATVDVVTNFSGTMLVVDDEADIREILSIYLENLGFNVDSADDGDTALLKVKQKKYDYICTDMKMKRMQGNEFIKAARLLPNGCDCKYFIISGDISISDAEKESKYLASMINGFICKPFSEQSLIDEFAKDLAIQKSKAS